MVQIVVNSFRNNESLAIYELPEGTSVRVLKVEIEATENIATNLQRLLYNERELHDEETIDAFSCGTIHLTKSRVHLHVWTGLNISPNPDTTTYEAVEVCIDLQKPVGAPIWTWDLLSPQDSWMRWGPTPSSCGIKIVETFTLDSQGQRRDLSDMNQPFSFYGIENGDTIHTRVAVRRKEEIWRSTSGSRIRKCKINTSHFSRIVKVKYSWDGNMNHSGITGLPLEPDALISIFCHEKRFGDEWFHGIATKPKCHFGLWLTENHHGYVPKNYVCLSEDNSVIEDVLKIPPLPPFLFPRACGMTFDVPIGDKGHSFLTISADYERLSCPADPTRVTMKLLSVTHGTRRISGINLFITVAPDNLITDIQTQGNPVPNEPIHVDREVTTNKSKGMQINEFNLGVGRTAVGIQGGVSSTYSAAKTEKGSIAYQKEVSVGLRKENTIFWNLKAPATNLDEKGLQGEEYMSFMLARKPEKFGYNCRVTHARDGVEKEVGRKSKA